MSALLGGVLFACSANQDEADQSTGAFSASVDESACTGTGWLTDVSDYPSPVGTYLRTGAAPAGELSQLTIKEGNGVLLAYSRLVDQVEDTGHIQLLTDNPAVGPALIFQDDSLQTKDVYWVIAQRRHPTSGTLAALCLRKAANGQPEGGAKAFEINKL